MMKIEAYKLDDGTIVESKSEAIELQINLRFREKLTSYLLEYDNYFDTEYPVEGIIQHIDQLSDMKKQIKNSVMEEFKWSN